MSSRRSAAEVVKGVFDAAGLGALPFALRFWDESEIPAAGPARFTVAVNRPRALAFLLREPNQLGLGRAWVSGDLDLVGELGELFAVGDELRGAKVGVAARLRAILAARDLGVLSTAWRLRPPAAEARPAGRLHSPQRDRRAISHHYDVSDDFYRIVLGPSLVYSCAYFDQPRESLEAAQARKLDLICRKLDLAPGERLLDVGCGWGSLVIHAAARYGVRAVGVTISEAQAELGRRRIREAGLADRCEIRLADYRELDDGPYDKVASVGMYEHVGTGRLDRYVAAVAALLRPGGLFLNHGIARLDSRPGGQKSFIARYVFPDGELQPLDSLLAGLRRAKLEVRDVESLREHYPLTLRRWGANLAARREEAIVAAGIERERVWRLYMTGSAHAFERGDITVFQTLAARPGAAHGLPLDRTRLAPPEPTPMAWGREVGRGPSEPGRETR
ncbi:MAG: cyclopropane-fatty-acyl-phospholipid synthase family protein [Solirubrobacterales bacterium]